MSMIHSDSSACTLQGVLRALANDERRALLTSLAEVSEPSGGASIGALAESTGVSRFTASRHLSILRQAGLVSEQQFGHERIQRRAFDGLQVLEDWLLDLLTHGAEIDLAGIHASRY